ncbi:MAG: CapA family protein [Pseudomonadota bacterium]
MSGRRRASGSPRLFVWGLGWRATVASALFTPGTLAIGALAIGTLAPSTGALAQDQADVAPVPSPPFSSPKSRSPKSPSPKSQAPAASDIITITVVGDTGLNTAGARVHPAGAYRSGRRHAWSHVGANVRDLLRSDVNIANLETVVTASNRLPRVPKRFSFRMHPEGFRYLIAQGFNAFSAANNHAMDYGVAGARDTLKYVAALRARGLLAAPGVGHNADDAARPHAISVRGTTLQFSSIGIGARRGNRAQAGQLAYNSRRDFQEVLTKLAAAPAAYRMLAVHYGAERRVRPAAHHVKRLRDLTVRQHDIDLVIGHHAHVAKGVQLIDGKIIFYGLGNFLHQGMRNMASFGLCRDFGVVGRVHLLRGSDGRLRARAIEVTPVRDMHLRVRRWPLAQAHVRIAALNYLADGLDQPQYGARGVRFRTRPDGTGLYCMANADQDPGSIGALCKGWRQPALLSGRLRARVRRSCGALPGAYVARRSTARKTSARWSRSRRKASRSRAARARARASRRKRRWRSQRRRPALRAPASPFGLF